jgi:hypothetical protein
MVFVVQLTLSAVVYQEVRSAPDSGGMCWVCCLASHALHLHGQHTKSAQQSGLDLGTAVSRRGCEQRALVDVPDACLITKRPVDWTCAHVKMQVTG